ncbi:MAG: hypothetical protein AB2421_10925 [Thermotaleaceae bacterium]
MVFISSLIILCAICIYSICIYSNKFNKLNKINLPSDICHSLTYRQRDFISNVFEQEELINKIPIGADYLEKDFISVTAEADSTLINDAYSIILSFKWDQSSNVSRDKLIILIDEAEWNPIESPSINLYTAKGKQYIIDRTAKATFGGFCFYLSGKDIISGTCKIQAIPQKKQYLK